MHVSIRKGAKPEVNVRKKTQPNKQQTHFFFLLTETWNQLGYAVLCVIGYQDFCYKHTVNISLL